MLFKSSLKTIIIGLGGIGLDYDLKKRDRIFSHAKSVSQSKNFNLIAGIDLVKRKRRIFSKIYKKSSFSNLIYLKKKNISFDLAIISVDTDKHLKIIKQLSSFNFKYCILEKPGAKNFRELKIILNILKRKGVKILLNYPRNYFNHYNKLTKILDKDNYIVCLYSRGFKNNCSHIISLFLKLGGKLKKIKLLDSNNDKNNPNLKIDLNRYKIFFINIPLKNCSYNKIFILNKKNIAESKNNLNSIYYSASYKSKEIKANYDYYDTDSSSLIKYEPKLQKKALEKMYSIFQSKLDYKRYYKLNYETSKILWKVQSLLK